MDFIFYKVAELDDLLEEATQYWEPWKAAYVHMIGYKMEEVYQQILGQQEEVPRETSQELLKEIEMSSPLYASMLSEEPEVEKVRSLHGHIKSMISTLVTKMIDSMLEEESEEGVQEQRRGEDFQTPIETDENEPSNTGKGVQDFLFPRDLFTAEKVNLPDNEVQPDVNIDMAAYLDGLVAISEEGHLDFLRGVPGTIVWQKNSVACWAPETQFKGIDIKLFKSGLPLFRIGHINNIPLWATFIPNNQTDEDEHFNLRQCKQLYNKFFENILRQAILKMPTFTSIRIRNCTSLHEKPVKYHIPGHEIDELSENLRTGIEAARLIGDFPAFLTFNFVAMTYGQDTPLTEGTVQYIENTFDTDKMKDLVVHLATNINAKEKSIFWTKEFAEKVFKSSGAVYQSCGFYNLANGAGKIEDRYRQTHLLGKEAAYMKVYNTVFKKMRRMIQDFHQGYSEDLLLEQPNMAKVLSYQPWGLPSACKKNEALRKKAKDFELQLPLKILEERLEMMESLDHLHDARVEFICSLKNTSIRECKRKYTGHSVIQIINYLSETPNTQLKPIVALSRDGISTYLKGLLSSLITPIKHAFRHFFVEKRPASPDVLETIHVCESLISFIIYGTKNYFPLLANIGLTIQRYKEVNRVTLAYTVMKTRTDVFRLDASANTGGTVYTISLPSVRHRTNEDAFTKQLLLIHQHLTLNKYNVAEILLSNVMAIIADIVFSGFDSNPFSIFGRPFVLSLPNHRVWRERITVSAVVHSILTFNFSDTMTNVVETAIESVGDLEADPVLDDIPTVGTTELQSALHALINLALKKKLMLDFTYFPVLSSTLRLQHFKLVVPDLCNVFKEGNPPMFHPCLTSNVLLHATDMMGRFNPFPNGMGIPDANIMFLLYTLLRADVHDVDMALNMLGVAVVLQKGGFTHTLKHHMRTYNITFRALSDVGLCRRTPVNTIQPIYNPEFRYHFDNFFTEYEKGFIRAHNNLCGSGLNTLM